MTSRVSITVGIVLAAFSFCAAGMSWLVHWATRPEGNDSWATFVAGGGFESATPSSSVDGSLLAFATPCTGHGDIYVWRAAGKVTQRLTAGAAFESSPMLTPDTSAVLFSREEGGFSNIWIAPIGDGSERRVTSGSYHDETVSVSPDGRYLIAAREQQPRIGHGRSVCYQVISLSNPSDTFEVGVPAVFAPDSRRVTFSEYPGAIVSVEIDDPSHARTRLNVHGTPTDWSSDGRLLAVTRRLERRSVCVIANLQNGTEQKVADGSWPLFLGEPPAALFHLDGAGVPCVLTLSNGSRTRLPLPPGSPSQPRLAHGHAGVLLTVCDEARSGQYSVYAVTADPPRLSLVTDITCTRLTPASDVDTH